MRYGNGDDWNRVGRVDLEGRENSRSLFLAQLGVLIAIDRSDPEDSVELEHPLVELLGEGEGLAIYLREELPLYL